MKKAQLAQALLAAKNKEQGTPVYESESVQPAVVKKKTVVKKKKGKKPVVATKKSVTPLKPFYQKAKTR